MITSRSCEHSVMVGNLLWGKVSIACICIQVSFDQRQGLVVFPTTPNVKKGARIQAELLLRDTQQKKGRQVPALLIEKRRRDERPCKARRFEPPPSHTSR